MLRFTIALTDLLHATGVATAQTWRRAPDAAQHGVERAVGRQAPDRARRATESTVDGMVSAGASTVRRPRGCGEDVVAFLVGRGTECTRLEAVGTGRTVLAADNATPEGRQQNRRVELVQL
ncbi:MAG: hypothetical protein AAGK21_15455 [Bacteroidota bacterium]